MKLILAATNPEVLAAWSLQFAKRPEVEVRNVDILESASDAFLLPGNSFGFLDGGLGLRISEVYGWDIEEEIRRRIRTAFDGELLVGQAIVLRLPRVPRAIVYTPIWRTPRRLAASVNLFLAARGAFLAMKKDTGIPPLESISLPPLGVDDGGELDPRIGARQIRYAYEIMTAQRGPGDKSLSQQIRRERKLQALPGAAAAQGAIEEPDE